MFPARYFSPRYWAARYWAKVGAEGAQLTINYRATLDRPKINATLTVNKIQAELCPPAINARLDTER